MVKGRGEKLERSLELFCFIYLERTPEHFEYSRTPYLFEDQ